MALPLQINSVPLRDFLVADTEAAWNLDGDHLFVDFPQVPPNKDALPRAYIAITDVPFGGESGSASGYAGIYSNTITLQRLKPSTGALQDAKEADANALLALLTAAPDYHGHVWFEQNVSVSFGDQQTEAGDGVYTVSVTFVAESYG